MRNARFVVALFAATWFSVFAAAQSGQTRPNIVIILADDLGYSDIGCFGGEIETRNLDQLAENGVRFTQFYNAARCCPSRAALLTGLYPHQAGVGLMVYRDFGPGYEGHLNEHCVTLGEVLGRAGYLTMFVGKWHAGHVPESRPEKRGFERFTGIYMHVDSYWKVLPRCDIYRDGSLFIPAGENPVNPYRPDEEFYTTDFFTDVAVDYIDQAARDPRPFFLMVCYNAPHFPLEAPEKLIEKYRGRYLEGWDVLRREKFQRMRRMGLLPPGQKLPEVRSWVTLRIPGWPFQRLIDSDPLPEWRMLSRADREELDFRRAIYAAQVERMDQNIGRLVRRLEEHEMLENTLIIFMSDNGCSGELGLFGMNWHKYRRANYHEWRKIGGWSISQGQCWAAYSNTPFRKFKMHVHEGGIASPLIVHWPSGIAGRGRIVNNQMFHIIDVMPTLCEVAEAPYPRQYNGRVITPCSGESFAAYLRGEVRNPPDRTLYWQHMTHAAIREGKWKLVTLNDRSDDAWELYDMSTDRSETENVIDSHPEVARRLTEKWREWARECHVVPYPEERGRPRQNPPPGSE